jgi:phosphoglycerate kinase
MGREFFTLDDIDAGGKTVLVRVDINSPIDPASGRILNDARMRNHLSTLRDLSRSRVVILAHQSRPGKSDFTTLEAHAVRLSHLLSRDVRYVDSLVGRAALDAIRDLRPGDTLLLENTRFFSEEVVLKGKPPDVQSRSYIVRTLSPLADYFVHDAFAAAHRSQPTLVGFPEVLTSAAGRVMEREVAMLTKAMHSSRSPKLAILGGIKVDDSARVMKHFLEQGIADRILTTGLVANVFLAANGVNIGKANREFIAKEVPESEALIEDAKALLGEHPDAIDVPVDVAVLGEGGRENVRAERIPGDRRIMDVGIDTLGAYVKAIQEAGSIIMNGPAGVFELEEFSLGTREIFQAVAESDAFTVIGGGHTVAVAEQLRLEEKVDHVSTGGGALMDFLCGKDLPGLRALRRSKERTLKAS